MAAPCPPRGRRGGGVGGDTLTRAGAPRWGVACGAAGDGWSGEVLRSRRRVTAAQGSWQVTSRRSQARGGCGNQLQHVRTVSHQTRRRGSGARACLNWVKPGPPAEPRAAPSQGRGGPPPSPPRPGPAPAHPGPPRPAGRAAAGAPRSPRGRGRPRPRTWAAPRVKAGEGRGGGRRVCVWVGGKTQSKRWLEEKLNPSASSHGFQGECRGASRGEGAVLVGDL